MLRTCVKHVAGSPCVMIRQWRSCTENEPRGDSDSKSVNTSISMNSGVCVCVYVYGGWGGVGGVLHCGKDFETFALEKFGLGPLQYPVTYSNHTSIISICRWYHTQVLLLVMWMSPQVPSNHI